jgi:hypothetical protein
LRPTQTSALRSSDSWPPAVKGGCGTGKSHVLIAVGTLVAEAGYRVRYPLAGKLVNALVEAADGKQLTKLINTDVYALGMCQMLRSFLALQRYSVPPGGGWHDDPAARRHSAQGGARGSDSVGGPLPTMGRRHHE